MNTLTAEFLKIRWTTYLVVFILTFFTSTVIIIVQTYLTPISLYYNPFALGYPPITVYVRFGVVLVVGFLCYNIIAGEYNKRTLGLFTFAAERRWTTFLGKASIIFIIAAIMPLLSWLTLILFTTASSVSPFLDIIEFEEGRISALQALAASFGYYIRALPTIALYTAFISLLTILFKSGIISFAISFILVVTDLVTSTILNSFALYDWINFLPSGWIVNSLGGRNAVFNVTTLENAYLFTVNELLYLLLLVGIAAVMYAVAILIFVKRDITET